LSERRADSAVAIVTGSGSGIGRAVCQLLSEAKFQVVLVGRHESSLRETAQSLTAVSSEPGHSVMPADVSDSQQCRRVVDATIDRYGRLDAIVNNAGAVISRPIVNNDQALFKDMFAVNAMGPAMLVAAAWPSFVKQRKGCVVNVSSMTTVDPFPGLSAYAMSKGAIESLTRSIVNEGRQYGIRAFTVAPGAVETAMLRAIVPEASLPASRTLDPFDVGRAVVACILGERDAEMGRVILLPSP